MNHHPDKPGVDPPATSPAATTPVTAGQQASHEHDVSDEIPFALRTALRAMRTDQQPVDDLWPSIAEKIDRQSLPSLSALRPQRQALPGNNTTSTMPSRSRLRAIASLALAASLILALGVAWQTRIEQPTTTSSPTSGLLAREADTMTVEYQAAWQALDALHPDDVDITALQQIDRSAAQVRQALRRDPNARYLFDQLQSLYTRRLDLSQRLASQHIVPI